MTEILGYLLVDRDDVPLNNILCKQNMSESAVEIMNQPHRKDERAPWRAAPVGLLPKPGADTQAVINPRVQLSPERVTPNKHTPIFWCKNCRVVPSNGADHLCEACRE